MAYVRPKDAPETASQPAPPRPFAWSRPWGAVMTQHRRLLLLPLLLLAGAAFVAALLLIPGAVGAQDAATPTNLSFRIVDGGVGVALSVEEMSLGELDSTDCVAAQSDDLAAITRLKFEQGGITSLASGDFANLGGLVSLEISGNPGLTGLPSDIFSSLTGLRHLALYDNALTALPVLSGLTDLRTLNLSFSQLETDDLDTELQNLTNLCRLELSENMARDLPGTAHTGLSGLKELYMPKVTTLEAGQFSALSALEILHLRGSAVSNLQASNFSGLGNLEELWVRNAPETLEAGRFAQLPASTVVCAGSGGRVFLPESLRGERAPLARGCTLADYGLTSK